ncbi:MAG TPA: protein phosphatase 2C domain-containing protein [Vicinamibacterales bacterium]|jgi:protein phosphatase|nr:protein phosphatase 2C domain-containing protein [Vicinamibacterales bacterium]
MPQKHRRHEERTTRVQGGARSESGQVAAPSRVLVEVSGLSHRGLVRENNEDHFLVARLDRTMQTLVTNLPPGAVPDRSEDTVYGMLVADGMGGHAAGELASRTAVATLVNLVLRTPDIIMRLDPHYTEEALRRFERRFQEIAEVLREQAKTDPRLAGMGTTMTLACSAGSDLIVAHVGDSRAYLLREGRLQRLTSDQTMAQFLADTGMISQDEIENHPMRHMLTGALSTRDGPTDVDLTAQRLRSGDQVLLCTDGLFDLVPDASISALLQQPGSPAEVCQRLVTAALEGGGRDNVTVVLGRYRIGTEGS